jgi:pyruvate formate-lyase/glycerol dehydratase family glycyl radical enzyme
MGLTCLPHALQQNNLFLVKERFQNIPVTKRIVSLRTSTMEAERFISLEQARIITRVYRENSDLPVILKRAKALAFSLREMTIAIDPEELIVGNRTPGIRAGIVFPEAGISWLGKEIETLPYRTQDKFSVTSADIEIFRSEIEPFWKGITLEDDIYASVGDEASAVEKAVKINQTDHAQGHICPDTAKWLKYGPAGLIKIATEKKKKNPSGKNFYESAIISLEASCDFIRRYSALASEMAEKETRAEIKMNLLEISLVCRNISVNPPSNFREALQSLWFLYAILHMESNASSFSPGRIDQYLFPFYNNDITSGNISQSVALELMDALFIKFNQIVYMRNNHSAMYFAGFPIGFNITVGGLDRRGKDATNELSFLILKAQDHVRLPQPNLTARLHTSSPDEFVDECTRVISLGTGMPQIVNDESIIPSLELSGVDRDDALDYSLVGCVELSTQGNYLGWSDAAMFNMVKVLELTLNNGKCMLTGNQIGEKTGYLTDYQEYSELEEAFEKQIDFFTGRMFALCETVERIHQEHLPSPFLSSVVEDCLDRGIDVTAGGAKYNFSGIQAIQVANIADSLSTLKELVYERRLVEKEKMLSAIQNNFEGEEILRQRCINSVPKYGNDVEWVDNTGAKWARIFAGKLKGRKNWRGGMYQMGLYTVSAHVPMGQNVGATPDGRLAGTVLADGGVSPMYGRDKLGPTAVLKSVSRLPFNLAGNGALLNMKFLPSFFRTETDRRNFSSMLRTFVRLNIHHVQFNVVNKDDLLKAKSNPDLYRGLTIRVAGYTAYFTELAEDLQNEIIQRTSYGDGY